MILPPSVPKYNDQKYMYLNYVYNRRAKLFLLKLSVEFFLKAKRMGGYVDGTFVKPKNENNRKCEKELESWEVNNLKIITWINNSFFIIDRYATCPKSRFLLLLLLLVSDM